VASALVAIAIGAFVLDVALMRAMTDQLRMNDFGKFYYSARAFLDGRDMYAPNPATSPGFNEAPDLQFLNMNPPHFHLLILPLAAMRPDRAVLLWIGFSIAALVASLLLIARELDLRWTPFRALAVASGSLIFAATQSFFVTGQLSLLLLLATTLCWIAARHGRWTAAAVWLGVCTSIKPFFLIFLPYFLLTRRLRAGAAVVATALVAVVAGLLTFGSAAYRAWYGALGQSGTWAWTVMNASVNGLFRRTFDAQPIASPIVVSPLIASSWIVIAAVIVGVTLVLTIRDRSPSAVDSAFALLLVAAQLVSPLGWIYYLWLPAGPIAALAARPGLTRALRRSRVGTAAVLLAAVGLAWPMPFLLAFQPHRWATVFIASIYFWATLATWVSLLVARGETPCTPAFPAAARGSE